MPGFFLVKKLIRSNEITHSVQDIKNKSSVRVYTVRQSGEKKAHWKTVSYDGNMKAIVPMKGQPMSGSKKVSISRANPFQMPLVMDFARLKTNTYRAI
jgi:hypothetical protein